MIALLLDVLGVLEAGALYLEVGLVVVINLLVVAIGAFLAGLLGLLPDMPATPTAPVAEWVGWLNWFFPVAELVTGLLVWVGVWGLYLIVRIPLRWMRAL